MTLDSNNEDLFPDTELASTNFSGTASDLQSEDTSTWYTADDPGTEVTGRWGMQDPSATLSGTQNVYIYVRHTGNGGDDAAFQLELYENGTEISTLIDTTVASTNTTGSEFSATWDASAVTNGADVEYRFASQSTGGMPGTRDVGELAYITWGAGLDINVAVSSNTESGVTWNEATFNGNLDSFTSSDGTADVRFDWGPSGDSLPNSTTLQNLSETGAFSDTVGSLSSGTEYEYQAYGQVDDGSVTDTGALITFETTGVVTDPASNVGATEAQLNGTVSLGSLTSVEARFDYRQVGSSTWNTTVFQTVDTSGSYSDTITGLSPTTDYEFRAYIESSDGTNSDTGTTNTFTTLEQLAGTCTLNGTAVSGAVIYVVNTTNDTVEVETTTDDNGNWSVGVPTGNTYHVAAQYDDGTDKYNEYSKPFLVV